MVKANRQHRGLPSGYLTEDGQDQIGMNSHGFTPAPTAVDSLPGMRSPSGEPLSTQPFRRDASTTFQSSAGTSDPHALPHRQLCLRPIYQRISEDPLSSLLT